MAKVYRITPLEKKSISWHIEMYRRNADDSISWFNIDDHYRWGQGFVEEDLECNLPFDDSPQAHAQTDVGWGAELDDQHACWFEFSDDISPEEREHIENCYHNGDPDDDNVPDMGGAAWLFDGTHDWGLEDDYLVIDAPFKVDLCDDVTYEVLEADVKLRNRAELQAELKANGSWPFPS